MNSNRLVVLRLYKEKMKICHKLGYNYGNWNNHFDDNYQYINFNKLKKYNKRKLTNYMVNNIRNQYKLHKDETEEEETDELIDFGFQILKDMNYLVHNKIK